MPVARQSRSDRRASSEEKESFCPYQTGNSRVDQDSAVLYLSDESGVHSSNPSPYQCMVMLYVMLTSACPGNVDRILFVSIASRLVRFITANLPVQFHGTMMECACSLPVGLDPMVTGNA